MTVEELIKELEKYPGDMQVRVEHGSKTVWSTCLAEDSQGFYIALLRERRMNE